MRSAQVSHKLYPPAAGIKKLFLEIVQSFVPRLLWKPSIFVILDQMCRPVLAPKFHYFIDNDEDAILLRSVNCIFTPFIWPFRDAFIVFQVALYDFSLLFVPSYSCILISSIWLSDSSFKVNIPFGCEHHFHITESR